MSSSKTGFTVYKGVMLQQNDNFANYFIDFLNKEKFVNIVETGTGSGNLTRFIREHCDAKTITTFDIYKPFLKEELETLGVKVVVKDIFGEKGTNKYMTEIDSEVKEAINNNEKTLVLCDGGNKPFEFKQCSKLIKPGDFIMAHDYVKSKDLFTEEFKNEIWGWCEITEADIQQACLENNLKDYTEVDFSKIVWACKYKSND
jgi:tRNA A58 N-methylase Trm61